MSSAKIAEYFFCPFVFWSLFFRFHSLRRRDCSLTRRRIEGKRGQHVDGNVGASGVRSDSWCIVLRWIDAVLSRRNISEIYENVPDRGKMTFRGRTGQRRRFPSGSLGQIVNELSVSGQFNRVMGRGCFSVRAEPFTATSVLFGGCGIVVAIQFAKMRNIGEVGDTLILQSIWPICLLKIGRSRTKISTSHGCCAASFVYFWKSLQTLYKNTSSWAGFTENLYSFNNWRVLVET